MSTSLRHFLVRRLDRVRGSGWLDCPNCHEHALQDVVDSLTFVCLGYVYRLAPILRRRELICRRCNHRRRATSAEMGGLETAGTRVRRAWLVPIGLSPFLAVLVIALVIAGHKSTAEAGLTFLQYDAGKLTVAKFELPSNYNQAVDVDSTPNNLSATDPSGRIKLILRRFDVNQKPDQLLAAHFDDDTNINALNVPTKVPQLQSTKVAGQSGDKISFTYQQSGDPVTVDIYAFEHNGIAYSITVQVVGKDAVDTARTVEKRFVESLSFAGNKETPGPSPSASPGASPGTSPSPGAPPSSSSSSSSSST